MSSPTPAATILVVDDNEANRALAQAALEDDGHRVVVAKGGLEALGQFASERPDCVVLDIRMPDLDGFEVCARLRALPGGAQTPVVFLTALRDVETFDRASLAGGDDFLTKPVRPSELCMRVQAVLELHRAHAERTVLYEELRRQRDDMLRAILQAERLAGFLVHDLKNPVSGMAMAADLILQDPAASQRTRDAALRIRTQADNLQRLIMNLLDLGKGDEGRLAVARTEVELPRLVTEVAHAFEVRASGRGIRIEARCPVRTVRADEMLLQRVLENLLENAIRHAPDGSVVTVEGRREEAATVLSVTDRGPGVPEELRERIFDRYFRLDAAAQKNRAGRGMGLAFCKVAVEAHGGSIGMHEAHPGSTFTVRLPDVP